MIGLSVYQNFVFISGIIISKSTVNGSHLTKFIASKTGYHKKRFVGRGIYKLHSE